MTPVSRVSMETEAEIDHGGRSSSSTSDADPAPYEGDDWLTDDPDGRGDFTVIDKPKNQVNQPKINKKSRKSKSRSAQTATVTATAATAAAAVDAAERTYIETLVAESSDTDNDDNITQHENSNFSGTSAASAAKEPRTLPVRITFPVTLKESTANAIAAFRNLFKAIHTVDPTLLIVGNDDTAIRHSDLPATPSAFTERLSLFINRPPSQHVTAEIICSLQTSLTLHDIKHTKSVSDFLLKKNLHIKHNPLGFAKNARVGFCRGICPTNTNRQSLRDHTIALLNRHMSEGNKQAYFKRLATHEIFLAVQSKPFFHGSGADRIQTQALEISCPLAVVDIIRQSLLELGPKKVLTWYTFIPTSLGRERPDFYRQQILLQNRVLSQLKRITVYGLWPQLLEADITYDLADKGDVTTTVDEYFYAGNTESIEPTNKSVSEGKYFFMTTHDKYDAACTEIDDFTDLIRSNTAPPSLRKIYPHGIKIIPKRKGRPNVTTTQQPSKSTASDAAVTTTPDSDMQQFSSWLSAQDKADNIVIDDLLVFTSPPASYCSVASRHSSKSATKTSTANSTSAATTTVTTATSLAPTASHQESDPLQRLVTIIDERFSSFITLLLKILHVSPEELQDLRSCLTPALHSGLQPKSHSEHHDNRQPEMSAADNSASNQPPSESDDNDTLKPASSATKNGDHNPKTDQSLTSADAVTDNNNNNRSAAVPPADISSDTATSTPVAVITPTKPKRKSKQQNKILEDLPPDIAMRAQLQTQLARQRRQQAIDTSATTLMSDDTDTVVSTDKNPNNDRSTSDNDAVPDNNNSKTVSPTPKPQQKPTTIITTVTAPQKRSKQQILRPTLPPDAAHRVRLGVEQARQQKQRDLVNEARKKAAAKARARLS